MKEFSEFFHQALCLKVDKLLVEKIISGKMFKIIKMKHLKECLIGALILNLAFAVIFVTVEPTLSRAIEDQFTVTQVINSEIAFATRAQDVVMTPSLGGITGGTSNGTTTVVVTTNDSSGYSMTIVASTSPAMQGDTQGDTIADYTPASAVAPDFTYSVPTGEEFGYTVSASTTSDLAQKFLDNTTNACNISGGADTGGTSSCWYGLSTTATSTIVRNSETSASGSTSSIMFKVTVTGTGFVAEDTYVATATLTAVTN